MHEGQGDSPLHEGWVWVGQGPHRPLRLIENPVTRMKFDAVRYESLTLIFGSLSSLILITTRPYHSLGLCQEFLSLGDSGSLAPLAIPGCGGSLRKK